MTQHDEAGAAASRRARAGRSPSYPAISLPAAIERAKIVYSREKRNVTPVAVMMRHWGYNNPTGGRASVTFAALKKFGLVLDEGSGVERPARLTDLATEIILNPHPEDAIRRAALMPAIHREMWEQYGTDLPSEDSLKWTLIQRGFTPGGAEDFIQQYRETLSFARLDELANEENQSEVEVSQAAAPSAPVPASTVYHQPPMYAGGSAGMLAIPIPIMGGPPITVQGKFPVTGAAWAQFLAVLQAMKPGLVAAPTEPSPDSASATVHHHRETSDEA